MTPAEAYDLHPWIEAGVGVEVPSEDPLHPSLVRKGYLIDHGKGLYSLTEQGLERAASRAS